jgi:hypothetical protein
MTAAADGRCPVGKALDRLVEREQSEMQVILDNGVASHVIAVWFTDKRNLKVTAAAVTSHRRGLCGCS